MKSSIDTCCDRSDPSHLQYALSTLRVCHQYCFENHFFFTSNHECEHTIIFTFVSTMTHTKDNEH